jgi:uncharacterized protein YecT (DUF1311 family)
MTRSVLAVLVTSIAVFCGQHGSSAQARCPHNTSDACDQWHFEEIDKQLTQVVAEAVEKIEKFAHPDARQEAKDALAESHRAFVASREADCRAEAAFMYLRTARARASYTASCMYYLTELRIARIRQRYLL